MDVDWQVEGKVGEALLFDDADKFLRSDDVSRRCVGDLQRCRHGLMVSMWLQFTPLYNHSAVLDTGYKGLTVLYHNNQLSVTATDQLHYWTVSDSFALLLSHSLALSVCLSVCLSVSLTQVQERKV